MKQLFKTALVKIYLTLFVFFTAVISCFSQDNSASTSSTTTTQSASITIQPWMWIVGGAVFVLILIALLRGGKNKDSVTVTKRTTIENSDV